MDLEYVEAAKLVSGKRGISMEGRQMVYVTETKLRLDVPKECSSRKERAVLNEPVTEKTNAAGMRSFWCGKG